jgi:hypothetical protein
MRVNCVTALKKAKPEDTNLLLFDGNGLEKQRSRDKKIPVLVFQYFPSINFARPI